MRTQCTTLLSNDLTKIKHLAGFLHQGWRNLHKWLSGVCVCEIEIPWSAGVCMTCACFFCEPLIHGSAASKNNSKQSGTAACLWRERTRENERERQDMGSPPLFSFSLSCSLTLSLQSFYSVAQSCLRAAANTHTQSLQQMLWNSQWNRGQSETNPHRESKRTGRLK